MAGQIAEIARDERGDFRTFDPETARILIVEALDRILTTFPESLSAKALRSLESLGRHRAARRVGGRRRRRERHRAPRRRQHGAHPDADRHLGRGRERLTAGADCSPSGPASRSTAPGAWRCSATSRSQGTPRCWRSATWSASASPTARALVLPGVAPVAMQQGRHAARAIARPPGRPRAQAVPATSTRATSPPSGAPARWPTSRACTSAASSRGSRGSSSTSGT